MDQAQVDALIRTVRSKASEWAELHIEERLTHLRRLQRAAGRLSSRWVSAAVEGKGLDPSSPLVGEEWVSGPWAFINAVNLQKETLESIATSGRPPLKSGAVRTRSDDQVIVRVFPHDLYDRLLLNGYRADVWMEPGVKQEALLDEMASFYRRPGHDGRVCVVLGAGNISSIAPMDVLYKMFGEGFVCVLKMHTVNDYLGPIFTEMFGDLVSAGYLQLTYGGADVGNYLVRHADVDEVHVTGNLHTYDSIVFGDGAEGEARRRRNEPLPGKRVTAELGGISPTIVVPGPWTAADVAFQAEHVVTQKLHNAGFNCVAAQVLVLAEGWHRSKPLMGQVRELMLSLPDRHAFYPGAAKRQKEAVEAHPEAETLGGEVERTLIADLDPEEDEHAFETEYFGGTLAQTSLPGDNAEEFLSNAVRFANEKLHGTLGAQLLIHPETISTLGPALEDALAELRYGSIGVNVWSGGGFLLAQTSWGGFPGQPANDIQSGTGVVHNTMLFDRPQKSIVYAPFRPFPRAWLHGEFHLSPKPIWFLTHRSADAAGRRIAGLVANPGLWHLPGIFAAALRS